MKVHVVKEKQVEKGRKSEKVLTLPVDDGLLESEPSSPVSLSPLLLPTATTMGQFFWSDPQQSHHFIFSEGIFFFFLTVHSDVKKKKKKCGSCSSGLVRYLILILGRSSNLG
ncbi:hypothetical protein OUZ56_007611 [Daphnia magna]|uniref:Uncharacterized protein n=1 Tax=Daphnia magna TaxID=35525 RepID=A0ABR0AAG5_9CRUS|nr:hypothetical protein OUZ56_007611 [Daphnia magna]